MAISAAWGIFVSLTGGVPSVGRREWLDLWPLQNQGHDDAGEHLAVASQIEINAVGGKIVGEAVPLAAGVVEEPKLDAILAAGDGDDQRATVWDFFFQAEDGIRDLTVTGVQTCALPI